MTRIRSQSGETPCGRRLWNESWTAQNLPGDNFTNFFSYHNFLRDLRERYKPLRETIHHSTMLETHPHRSYTLSIQESTFSSRRRDNAKITNYSLSLFLFRIKRLSRITNGDGLRSPLVFPREPGNFRRFARSTQGRASGLFLLVVICPLLRRKKEVREDRSIEV